MFGFALLACGIFTKYELLSKAGLVTFIVAALVAIPAFMTGEDSGTAIKGLPEVSEGIIDTHEVLAEKINWFFEIGGLSLAALFLLLKWGKKIKTWFIVIFILSLVTMGMMLIAGNTEGQIRHSEIRSQ